MTEKYAMRRGKPRVFFSHTIFTVLYNLNYAVEHL
jgi:hypothetical protein